MIVYFFLVFGLYGALVLALITGWQLTIERDDSKLTLSKFLKISVIVPFRDEEQNLPALLESFNQLDYPAEHTEFIFVDDHSSDSSQGVIKEFIEARSNAKLLQLESGKQGKKQALAHAIGNASGEIILTTDADCTVSPKWLSVVSNSFQNEEIRMLVGAVKIIPSKSFFSKMQSLEFASLIGSGAATLLYGLPTMSNGANLAFRKSAFSDVDGYKDNFNIPSGDDEFLMRKINHKFPKSIAFLSNPESVVSTQPQQSLSIFIQQRIRWAGKWKFNQSLFTKLLAIFIFIFQTSVIFLSISVVVGWLPAKVFSVLMGTKLLVEFLFLYQVFNFLKLKWSWTSFLALQFIYPFYVFAVAVLSQKKSFVWKGRTTKQGTESNLVSDKFLV